MKHDYIMLLTSERVKLVTTAIEADIAKRGEGLRTAKQRLTLNGREPSAHYLWPASLLKLACQGHSFPVVCLPQTWATAHSLHFPVTSPSVMRYYQTRMAAQLDKQADLLTCNSFSFSIS